MEARKAASQSTLASALATGVGAEALPTKVMGGGLFIACVIFGVSGRVRETQREVWYRVAVEKRARKNIGEEIEGWGKQSVQGAASNGGTHSGRCNEAWFET